MKSMNSLPMQHFATRLNQEIISKKTPLIVGLDPRAANLPETFQIESESDNQRIAVAYERFCASIIDIVAPLVPAVKPQAAFFEALGPAGMFCLAKTVTYAQQNGLIVVMDGKRGDIGSTATAYASAFLGDPENSAWHCDALTVNPYLGDDSLAPFVERCVNTGTGIFVLVRTSNPGGAMLQELLIEKQRVFQNVADHIQGLSEKNQAANGYGVVGAVVGATHPEQLFELRSRMPNSLFLVPGFGAQGGTAKDVAGAFDDEGLGALINSSRAIIFAHQREEYQTISWEQAVERATKEAIEKISNETPAGKLRA